MMAEEWRDCVNRLLRAWTGYQLAIRMLSGGPTTHQKAEWFGEVLADYVSNTQNLREDSLNDWINDILDNEFDLILEDNSTEWIVSSLLRCREWLIKGEKAQLESFLSQLPSESAIQTATTESQVQLDSSDSDETSDSEEELRPTTQNGQQAGRSSRRRMETDEDGWTTITRR